MTKPIVPIDPKGLEEVADGLLKGEPAPMLIKLLPSNHWFS